MMISSFALSSWHLRVKWVASGLTNSDWSYGYDPVDRLTEVITPRGESYTTEYDLAGRMLARMVPNATAMARSYEDDDDIWLIIKYLGTERHGRSALHWNWFTGSISGVPRIYDLNGNKLNATKTLRDAGQQLIDRGGLASGKNLGKGVQVNVNGLNVTIRGANVGGKFRLGTAFIPWYYLKPMNLNSQSSMIC